MKTFKRANLKKDKLVYLTPPHAPVLVSTISPDGNYNLGTFEQFMSISNNPPKIILSITPDSDTYKNIIDGSDFCIGIPTLSLTNQIYDCGLKLPREKSEFGLTKLTPSDAKKNRAPWIMECSINLECTLENNIYAGDHYLIIGNVIHAVIKENIYSIDKIERRLNINAPYYISSGYFFKMGKIINTNKSKRK